MPFTLCSAVYEGLRPIMHTVEHHDYYCDNINI